MADIEKIKKLRSLSGAGFKDCSAALIEANGQIDKAIEILRVKGISRASKKMSRSANEGLVSISENDQKISICSEARAAAYPSINDVYHCCFFH